ncbi:DUF3408 domain-containing protein [Dysgonomonas sp. UBA7698]|uniref:DUF3408 domain-containing protein n=1 Tax=Dysgonomonas sp. UBA7698 TaxID=1946427 RepID=UPI0025B82C7A|nr:DUF3408 domain-containing protein [Dysgonomonas sp. UBA7698]
MSKDGRTIVKVDEDKIKRMIAGEEPYLEKETKKEEESQESVARNKESITSRKRPIKSNYGEIFLKTVRTNDKKQTTVQLSESVFKKMEILLKVTKGLSMGLFINNVLIHHFEEYEEDIQAIKKIYITKLSEDV